jgi:hypothetical protein
MKIVPSVIAMLLLAAPAAAGSLAFLNYSGCVQLTKYDAKKALVQAREWEDAGGDAAAAHCAALALSGLKRYSQAAGAFEALAKRRDIGDFRERAALYDQAANAWLLAGQAAKAVLDSTAALALTPNDVEMRAARARARALQKDWLGADADLTAALLMDQNRADLLSLRASARRALGRKVDAASDILRALTIYPDYPAALIERGAMKYEAGDRYGARKDWQKASRGRGETAAAAKRLLSGMGPDPKPLVAK